MIDRMYVILGLAVLGHLSIICCVIFHICYKECKKKKTIDRHPIVEEDLPIEETYVQSEVVVTGTENTGTDQSHRLVTGRPKITGQTGFSTVTWVASLSNRIQNIMSRGQRQRSSTVAEDHDTMEVSQPNDDDSLPSYRDALSMQLDGPQTISHLRHASLGILAASSSVIETACEAQSDQTDDPPKYDDMFEYTSL